MMLQGGTSTGRTTMDNCDIVDDLPEMLQRNPAAPLPGSQTATVAMPASACHVETKFLTDFKLLGTYTVPRVDVQVAATLQSVPGAEILANYVATNAVVMPGLGRPLAGNAANTTVNIVTPGTLYGERSNSTQLRVSRVINVGRSRTTASVDIYNVFNSNTVLTLNNSFAAWQRPLSIPNARWAKLVLQVDF
jgi:hypothetical protein